MRVDVDDGDIFHKNVEAFKFNGMYIVVFEGLGGWEFTLERCKRYNMSLKYVGMRGWAVNETEITILDDEALKDIYA